MKICRCCGAEYEASQDPNVCSGCANLEIPARAPDDDRRPLPDIQVDMPGLGLETSIDCRKAAENLASDMGAVFGSRKQGLEWIDKMTEKFEQYVKTRK